MLYFVCFISTTVLGLYSDELDIHRVLHKRDALDNLMKDEPTSSCRNGGILSHGECHCPFPHTGTTCQDFDCRKRYDPNSFLFSKPCLCQNGFNGDMCQYRLENKCSGKGEWKNGRCNCIEFFFGDYCQFTTHCVFGSIKHGRCICHKGYEGNYCHKIVCYHGYPNARNQSQSCICPAKYNGLHCDECAQVGPHIAPYPICVFNRQSKTFRLKNTEQAMSRFTMMAICGIFLLVVLLIMLAIQIHNKKKKNPEAEEIRMREWDERKRMLAEAAMKSEQEPEETKTRKISFANLFKRRQSADVRKTSVFQRFKRQQSSPSGFHEELSFSTLT